MKTQVPIICSFCKNPSQKTLEKFNVWKKRGTDSIYCSRKCAANARIETNKRSVTLILNCSNCSKEVERRESEHRKNLKREIRTIACSKKCQNVLLKLTAKRAKSVLLSCWFCNNEFERPERVHKKSLKCEYRRTCCSQECQRQISKLQRQESLLNFKKRLWSQISIILDRTSCWDWISNLRTSNGYGSIRLVNKTYMAHRMAFESVLGEIPPKLILCHKCDNKKCCRPSHIYAGTHEDNSRDAVERGRISPKYGRLSKSTVCAILKLHQEEGLHHSEITKRLNLPKKGQAYCVLKRRELI